jgi:hypothetical protein
MVSFTPGIAAAFGGLSIGLVVAFLKAASAALNESTGRRLPGDFDIIFLPNYPAVRPLCLARHLAFRNKEIAPYQK